MKKDKISKLTAITKGIKNEDCIDKESLQHKKDREGLKLVIIVAIFLIALIAIITR